MDNHTDIFSREDKTLQEYRELILALRKEQANFAPKEELLTAILSNLSPIEPKPAPAKFAVPLWIKIAMFAPVGAAAIVIIFVAATFNNRSQQIAMRTSEKPFQQETISAPEVAQSKDLGAGSPSVLSAPIFPSSSPFLPSGISAPTTTIRQNDIGVSSSQENEWTNISVFFPNKKLDPQFLDCKKVFATTRRVLKTIGVASTALSELLAGPSEKEKTEGFFSQIPQGTGLRSIKIKNGIVYADFDAGLESNSGGACRAESIRSAIETTLKQFSTVLNVVISINGRTEDVLQP